MKRALPLLEASRQALETCGYCPKLCRSTCPVSNVTAREALIPWAKMSSSWLTARGDLASDSDTAETSWGCTGCHGCTEFCEHANPVADTLYAARSAFRDAGVAPASVVKSERRHALRLDEAEAARAQLSREPGVRSEAPVALLVGCAYLRKAPAAARALVRSMTALAGSVRLVAGCCGAPLLHAGDRQGFEQARAALAQAARGAQSFVVGDSGCALVLRDVGAQPFVTFAAEGASALRRVRGLGDEEPVRFHDPCALGRGLGEYDAPRAVLRRALGRDCDEFSARRGQAECSGGGALLPVSMPDTSAQIAELRLGEHRRLGGGRIVTACAASLRRFRAQGARAVDIASVVEQSLGLTRE